MGEAPKCVEGDLGDEMIIVASSGEQFRGTVDELEKGPLEGWVAERIDRLWDSVKDGAPVDNLRAVREVVGGLNN